MEIKSDLSKAKNGAWCCTAEWGWQRLRVEGLKISTEYKTYYGDGTSSVDDRYPTCFLAGQVPEPYLKLFGPPPCEFKQGDRVWVSHDKIYWYAGIYKEYFDSLRNGVMGLHYIYKSSYQKTEWFEYCAPWNGGTPPEGD